MRTKILGLVFVLAVISAGTASACPPCSQWWQWTGTTSCTPAQHCFYCCERPDNCYYPQHCGVLPGPTERVIGGLFEVDLSVDAMQVNGVEEGSCSAPPAPFALEPEETTATETETEVVT